MQSIGLNSKKLIKIGIIENLSCLGENLELIAKDANIPNDLKQTIAEREAILQSIAKMIEENNKAILEVLKHTDILEDEDSAIGY